MNNPIVHDKKITNTSCLEPLHPDGGPSNRSVGSQSLNSFFSATRRSLPLRRRSFGRYWFVTVVRRQEYSGSALRDMRQDVDEIRGVGRLEWVLEVGPSPTS